MTSSNIHTQLCEDTGCCAEDLTEAMNEEKVAREGQGYPCGRHDMMMMIANEIGDMSLYSCHCCVSLNSNVSKKYNNPSVFPLL